MITVLSFRASSSLFCLPVTATRAIRPAMGMASLPAARDAVVGLLPGDPPLTVIAPLGRDGRQVVVVETPAARFGLLVDEVIGLRRVGEDALGAAPSGQARPLITASVHLDGEILLLADPLVLAEEL